MTQPATGIDLDLLRLIPEREQLLETARAKRAEYALAEPFPHICIDNFLPASTAEAALAAFPSPKGMNWHEFRTDREKKLASGDETTIPPTVRNVLGALNSLTFLRFLEEMTGIPGLIPDPQYEGGGLHQILPGGKLAVHVDFNLHPRFRLDRRLNLLVYLNKDWQEDYGGHFELWKPDGSACVKRILPVFNRCVVFSTTETSYHGHPHPLTCPPDRTRKSLALYYYTNGRPEHEKARDHTTRFVDLPEDRTFGKRLVRGIKTVARALTPPVLYRLMGREHTA